MRPLATTLFAVALMTASAAMAQEGIVTKSYQPNHDTWATHDDKTVHGFETVIKVGIEPQQCVEGGWNPCKKDDMECCQVQEGWNFCAPPGKCELEQPKWNAFRKFRGYLRFDLAWIPEGKVVSATLRLNLSNKVTIMGGNPKVEVYRLKSIGDNICQWNEATLNDTNLTTWSSLPQNVSVTPEGMWLFDVTKAVTDWVNGNSDQPGSPIAPNCGFHLADPDYGKEDAPIARWVEFSSKEGNAPPELSITIAQDLDKDGYYGDCNESDPLINPGAIETCDGIDQDCDGLTDEENCDGFDNDCDGLIDEGENLCGDGQACIFHQCIVTCTDECAGPYDLKCVMGDKGVWERWACGQKDSDPCLDWYKAAECDPGEFCNYGSCSFNCVDDWDCEPEKIGVKTCFENSIGEWFVASCDDWDGDGCLEMGGFEPCGPGATCSEAACVGGCTDACEPAGSSGCLGDLTVVGCYDSSKDGCLEWNEMGTCEEGKTCVEGDCVGQTTCTDECTELGTHVCKEDGGIPTQFVCVADGDDDPCLELSKELECPFGCNDEGTECNPDVQESGFEPTIEPAIEPQPDIVTSDLAQEEIPGEIPAGNPDAADSTGNEVPTADAQTDQPYVPAVDEGGEKKTGDDGCGCRVASNTPLHNGSILVGLLLAALYLVLRRRSFILS